MNSKVLILSAVVALAAAGCAQPAMSMDRKIFGKTASDLFPDPKVAALAKAACSGNQKGVDRQIAAGADPNSVGNEQAVPLLWAMGCRNVGGVEALLKAGANPNQLLGGDATPMYAAAQGPNEILKMMLKYGGDPNAGSKESTRSALIEAMSLGINGRGWKNYYTLLEAGADINRVYGAYNTIAQFAAATAQYEKLAELLENGYNRNLDWLGAFVQNVVIRPDLEPKRAKVKAMLEARGVKFPVPQMRPPGT